MDDPRATGLGSDIDDRHLRSRAGLDSRTRTDSGDRNATDSRQLTLGTDLCNIAVARRFVADATREAIGASPSHQDCLGHLADLELLTSELVANALVHTETDIRVEVRCTDGRARVAVHDGDLSPPKVNGLSSKGTSGRGLAIVEALATEWGFELADHEKVVWFEIDLRDPRPPDPDV